MSVTAAVAAAICGVMRGAVAGPLESLPTVTAKTARKPRKAAAIMLPSTMPAMRRRLKDAVWGAGMGWYGASATAWTVVETGRAGRRMDDPSGAADSTAGAVEIWAASTSKIRSWAVLGFWWAV